MQKLTLVLTHVQVAEEFVGIFPGCDVQLRDVWPRANILQKAQELAIDDGDVQSMLSGLQDQWNEGLYACIHTVVKGGQLLFFSLHAYALNKITNCK